jgi:endonuclease/exonuclease/phosphatase family metal-dependent hydrolase
MNRALLPLLLLLALPAQAAELKVATWNLNWFTARPTGDPELPQDVKSRGPDDFSRLAGYAAKLDPDVVALEEVDGPAQAAKLFPPDRYALHFTQDHVIQRVGLAIRRGIGFTANPDVTGLDPYPEAHFRLRSGADVTLNLPAGPLRILAVHLKTGCQEEAIATSHRRACETLRAQLPVLTAWVAQRQAEGVAFILLGDFNRVLSPRDGMLAALDAAAPLIQVTAGHASPCWGGGNFIDQIMLGGPARAWLQPDSLRVMVYAETGAEWHDRLSDHCPVSARLTLPN